MSDFSQTRSNYLKIMMGDRKDAMAPYRPDQLNDVGDTSFDMASLSNDDINNVISMSKKTKSSEKSSFDLASPDQNGEGDEGSGKHWLEQVGDFFSNVGTSIVEGVFNAVDSVWDFALGIAGGIGGGWYGKENDFTDWVANAMTDDRWVDYATKATTLTDFTNKDFWTNEGGFWTDWSYDNIKREREENLEGMEWIKNIGNFVGELVPSLVLAAATGGTSTGVQLGAQAGLGFASSMGSSQSMALSEGADFGSSSLYGLTEGGINAAFSALSVGVGGTLSSNSGSGIIKTAGQNFGKMLGKKTGSKTVQVVADKSAQIVLRSLGATGSASARTALEPAVKLIYDEDAWYNAYGTDENIKRYGEVIANSALTAAAGAAIANTGRELLSVASQGLPRYKENYFYDLERSNTLKRLTRSERRDFIRSQREYADYIDEVRKIQNDVDRMAKKGASPTQIRDYLQTRMEKLAPKIEAWSDKYQDFYSKLSFEVNDRLKLNAEIEYEGAKAGAKKFGDSLRELNTASGLKQEAMELLQKYRSSISQFSDIIDNESGNGGGQATFGNAVLTYRPNSDNLFYGNVTDPSLPVVEVGTVGGIATLLPTNGSQMLTIASLARDPVAFSAIPSRLSLPLKKGSSVVSIEGLNGEQVAKIATARESDFAKREDGLLTKYLGEGKTLVLSSDISNARIENEVPSMIDGTVRKPSSLASIGNKSDTNPSLSETSEFNPLNLKESPSVVKKEAQSNIGKVYSLASAKSMVSAVEDSIQSLLELDNLGGKTEIGIEKAKSARDVFDALNLGTAEQKEQVKGYLKQKLLDAKVDYKLKSYYGEDIESYSGTWREFLATMGEDGIKQFDDDFDRLYGELLESGDDTAMTKVINKYASKIREMATAYQELKAQTKEIRHIEKHRSKLMRRYWHGKGEDFAPGISFDTEAYKVLLKPFSNLVVTANGQSYSGKSVFDAFTEFLQYYNAGNYKVGDDGEEVAFISSFYNEGLRDVANILVQSIADNAIIGASGNVKYRALTAEQLRLLRLFQDEVEQMPKRMTADALKATSEAKTAFTGVERYVSGVLKDGKIGNLRKLLQGYAERFSNQLDALMYELGDNELTRTVYNDLYKSQALKNGMVDEFREKLSSLRKDYGVSNKALNAKSSFLDINGKPIEMKYLMRLYQHLSCGNESNNAKYVSANTVYIKDDKNKIAHIAKFSYSDLDAIRDELDKKGLLKLAIGQKKVESKDLGDVYDQDYLRDTHIPNSNREDNYTHIELESNRSEVGKAYIKSGVAKYGNRKDRVTNIPKGVHLVLRDPEIAILSQVSNQANIHYNDPVLKRINAMLNTKFDENGNTLKEYISENNGGALKLIERAVNGAYGINPNKSGKFIDFLGNGYVVTLIGFNPGSILRQPLSILWSNDISIGTVLRFTVGANLNPKIWKNTSRLMDELKKEFPDFRLRNKNNEAIMGNMASDAVKRVQNAISKVAGYGLKVADAWTVGHEAVGLLSLQAQELGYGEIGTKENDEYVKSHYVAFYATQVSSNRVTMSGARAGYYGGMGKLFSFMTGAVQGQVGYIARFMQQLSEYKGKTQAYFDERIANAKKAEETAKANYEEAQTNLEETQNAKKEGTATANDVKKANEELKDAFRKYSEATGERADAEHSAKGFRHYSDMGGTKGAIANRVSALILTGLSLVLINELVARLKGNKEWDEFDAGNAAVDFAISSTIGWIPVLRDFTNALKGYDLEIPEYAMMKHLYDLIGTIGAVASDPSDKNSRALIRQAIASASAFFGIPTSNLWKYVNGIIKTFSPSTALKMNNVLYGASPARMAGDAKEFAMNNDISSSADMYQSLYAIAKTGEISRDVAVEQAKLVREGFNPIARNVPDYVQGEDGERVYLSDAEMQEFSKWYSKANVVVSKVIASNDYRSLSSETKAKRMKKVYDLYYELALHKSVGREPNSRLGALLAYTDGDYDIAQALLLIEKNAEFTDNRMLTKKEQAVRLVNRQPMSKNQKLLALYVMGYGLSEENEKALRKHLISIGFTKKQAEEFIPARK